MFERSKSKFGTTDVYEKVVVNTTSCDKVLTEFSNYVLSPVGCLFETHIYICYIKQKQWIWQHAVPAEMGRFYEALLLWK